MYKIQRLIIVVILLLLIGCQNEELLTPTPFPPTPEGGPLGISGSSITPVPAVLADVMANPEFYEGAHLLVTGQYYRHPIQVCGLDPYPSPAGWDLVSGDVRLPAGGFDSQLRQLMPDGITMTVIGRLAYWEGPVGCGKQAVPTEMWYLDVVKLVDPAQLAKVTLTPGNASDNFNFDGDIDEDLFTPIADSTEDPFSEETILPTSPPIAPPTNTTQPTSAVPIETLGAGFTPVATEDISSSGPTGTATNTGSATVVNNGSTPGTTPSATPLNGSGIGTVTNTPPPGASATPTPNGGNSSTPIATADNNSNIVIQDEELEIDFYQMVDMNESEIHEWTMTLDIDENVYISVVGESDMDMGFKIFDESLFELANQDKRTVGEVETFYFEPPKFNDFKIRASENNGDDGGYLIAVGSDDAPLFPQGELIYSTGKSASIGFDDLHVWFFRGEEDDNIDLAISCDSLEDLIVFLYDPAGDIVAESLFDSSLSDILLGETGWYVIEVLFLGDSPSGCNYNVIVSPN